MAVFWIVVSCNLVEVYWHFRGACWLHHHHPDGAASTSKTLVNFCQDYTVQPRRQPIFIITAVITWNLTLTQFLDCVVKYKRSHHAHNPWLLWGRGWLLIHYMSFYKTDSANSCLSYFSITHIFLPFFSYFKQLTAYVSENKSTDTINNLLKSNVFMIRHEHRNNNWRR
jgi:hypothetical protein